MKISYIFWKVLPHVATLNEIAVQSMTKTVVLGQNSVAWLSYLETVQKCPQRN